MFLFTACKAGDSGDDLHLHGGYCALQGLSKWWKQLSWLSAAELWVVKQVAEIKSLVGLKKHLITSYNVVGKAHEVSIVAIPGSYLEFWSKFASEGLVFERLHTA